MREASKAVTPVTVDATKTGSVVLRGVTVALDSDVGQVFVADCTRNVEGLLPDSEIKNKYELSHQDWEQLASNTPLLYAVRAERARRISNSECAREAARLHFAKAPNVLNRILTDEQVAPRHRIEAARELRQVVDSGPDTAPGSGEKFTITINLGGGETQVFEKERTPRVALPSDDDGELP